MINLQKNNSTGKGTSALILVAFLAFAGVVLAAKEPTAATTTATVVDANTTVVAKQPSDPIAMLQKTTTEVLQALQQNKNSGGNNTNNIYAIVDKYILPHVDFNEMSEWVAGRTAWGKASAQTRSEFVSVFRTLVVRTYAKALNSYSDEKVEFGPQKIDTSKQRIQVSSTIVRKGKENVRVDFRLVQRDSDWYVYDIIIEGVSILQGFQAQFSDQIRQSGLSPVIADIRAHNAKIDAKS